MTERKFVTIIRFGSELLSDVGKFCEALQRKDVSFSFEIKKVRGQWLLLVYSRSKNQARMRGQWLTGEKTGRVLRGLDFRVTHMIALETALSERPKTVKGLRQLWKEKKNRF